MLPKWRASTQLDINFPPWEEKVTRRKQAVGNLSECPRAKLKTPITHPFQPSRLRTLRGRGGHLIIVSVHSLKEFSAYTYSNQPPKAWNNPVPSSSHAPHRRFTPLWQTKSDAVACMDRACLHRTYLSGRSPKTEPARRLSSWSNFKEEYKGGRVWRRLMLGWRFTERYSVILRYEKQDHWLWRAVRGLRTEVQAAGMGDKTLQAVGSVLSHWRLCTLFPLTTPCQVSAASPTRHLSLFLCHLVAAQKRYRSTLWPFSSAPPVIFPNIPLKTPRNYADTFYLYCCS